MYGEQSQQQSTAAKIDTQGGVSAAVGTDVTDATLKASKQQAAVSGEIAQQLMKANPKMESDEANKIAEALTKGGGKVSEDIAKALNAGVDINALGATAIAGAGALAGTMAQGKTAADLKSVSEADRLYEGRGGYIGFQEDAAMVKTQSSVGDTKGQMDVPEEQRENFIQKSLDETERTQGKEKRAELQEAFNRAGLMDGDKITPENWVSGTGYLRANNMNSSNALVAAGMSISGALGKDSTVKIDALDSAKTGKETSHSNDVTKLNNTSTQDQIALARNGGDVQEAAEYSKKVDAVKYGMDPRNEIAHAGAEAANAIESATGMDGEAAALLATGLGAGGTGLALLNKFTKEPVKFSESQREKLTPIKGEDGELKGYSNSKGDRVADREGFVLDKSGKKVERGAVSRAVRNSTRAMGGLKDNLIDKFSPASVSTKDEAVDGSTDNQDGKNNNSSSKHNDPLKDNIEGNSPSKDSISNTEQTSKSTYNPAKQIDAQVKYESKRAEQVAYNEKVNELNGNNPEMIKKQNAKLAAFDGAHAEHMKTLEKPNFKVPEAPKPDKGFFGSRFDAVKEAIDGGGNWKTKVGLATSGMLLGSTSAFAGNLMQAADPTSFFTGTEAGSGAFKGDEAKQMRAEFSNKQLPDVSSLRLTTPVAPPQHIQNAFSTPTGFNTSQAMSAGGSNYVDNTKFVSEAESSGANRNIRSSTRDSSNQCQRYKLCRV